jgi:hypothetical protein
LPCEQGCACRVTMRRGGRAASPPPRRCARSDGVARDGAETPAMPKNG